MTHRVPFYETDAMGIVHHSNAIRYFELARIEWLDRFDRPYTDYNAAGLHFATTRVEADYHRSVRFDERLRIGTWLEWARGASIAMAYRIEIATADGHSSEPGALVYSGRSEHAAVDDAGRVRRIPKPWRENLRSRVGAAEN